MKRASVNIYEAKTRLSQLVDQAAAGDDVVIGRAGKPVALLTALTPTRRKVRFGLLRGKIRVADDFDAPLPNTIIAAFAGR